MVNIDIIQQMAENQGKRDVLLRVMEDMRIKGYTDLHLKYMEEYDSLKSEYKELEAKLQSAAA